MIEYATFSVINNTDGTKKWSWDFDGEGLGKGHFLLDNALLSEWGGPDQFIKDCPWDVNLIGPLEGYPEYTEFSRLDL